MWQYYAARIRIAVRQQFGLLLTPFIAVALYLAATYAWPHRFIIETSLAVPDTMVAYAQRNGGTMGQNGSLYYYAIGQAAADEISAGRTAATFLLTPRDLSDAGLTWKSESPQEDWRSNPDVVRFVDGFQIALPDGGKTMVLRYDGPDREIAERLVAVLATRLASHLTQYLLQVAGPHPTLAFGPTRETAVRYQLPEGGGLTAALIFFVAACLTLVLVVIREMTSRTLTSESETVRYLGIAALGMMPKVSEGAAHKAEAPVRAAQG